MFNEQVISYITEEINRNILKQNNVYEEKNLKDNINKQLQEKKLIIENSNNISTENPMYIKLKNRLINIVNRKTTLEKRKEEINISIASKKILLNDYIDEKKDIEATLEVNYKLTIDKQIIECPLCYSKVYSKMQNCDRQSQEILKNIQKGIEGKIKLVKSLIEKDLNELRILVLKLVF